MLRLDRSYHPVKHFLFIRMPFYKGISAFTSCSYDIFLNLIIIFLQHFAAKINDFLMGPVIDIQHDIFHTVNFTYLRLFNIRFCTQHILLVDPGIEVQDEFRGCSPEPVNGLVIVTNDHHAFKCRQHLDPFHHFHLEFRCVLEFIDYRMPEPITRLQIFRVFLDHLES